MPSVKSGEDLWARMHGDGRRKKGTGPYSDVGKDDLERELEQRDFEADSRFKQAPSAIDKVTDLVAEPLSPGSETRELGAIFRELLPIEDREASLLLMTQLNRNQIRAIGRGIWMCRFYEYDLGMRLINTLMTAAVSLDRRGRREFLSAIASTQPVLRPEEAEFLGSAGMGDEAMKDKAKKFLDRWR